MTDARVSLDARQPKAIQRALGVLEEVALCGPGVTAQEIARRLQLPPATAYRLLNLLVQEEYLVRLPDLSGFALGQKVTRLGNLATASPSVSRAARSVLDSLRAHFRGGIVLVGYLDDRLRLLDTDPDYPLSDPRRIVDDLSVSAVGRLLLSERGQFADDDVVRELRDFGCVSQFDSLRPGFGCVAMPVRDADGALVAGLAASAPTRQLRDRAPILTLLGEGTTALAPLLS